MATYKLRSAVRGECHLEVFGRFTYDFDSGTVTPKSEQEAAVLARLVARGVAEVVTKPKKDADDAS